MKKSNILPSFNSLQVILKREDFSTITKTFTLMQGLNFDALIEDVKFGVWKFTVIARDSTKRPIYSVDSFVEIYEGSSVSAEISLSENHIYDNSLKIDFAVLNFKETGWQNYLNNPLIEKFGNDFDARGITGSFVLKESAHNYKMWYFTYTSTPGGFSNIFFAESKDGLNWNRPSDKPALYMGEKGSWDWGHVGGQAVIKIDNQYVMYYTGWENFNYDWNIGRAVSNDGLYWVKDPNPVFYAKDSTSWEYKIQVVSVLKINGIYHLYYHGKQDLVGHKIALATSKDGINWTRYKNNPILQAEARWEGEGIYYPSVSKVGNKYVMIYSNLGITERAFGLAYSDDGIIWEKDSSNPHIRTADFNKSVYEIGYPQIIFQSDRDILYFSSFNLDGTKTINALIRENKSNQEISKE